MSAAAAQEGYTRSVEDYLKAIYALSAAGTSASTSDIAQRLDLTAASVSGMIKRLSEQGLLEHEPYKGVQLTDYGRRVALRMVRRHRIIESYLVAHLDYTWDAVHEEAERLEHAVSDTLVERMAQALGNPGTDPHGEPIPGADGSIAEIEAAPLIDFLPGDTVEVRRVASGDPELLRYLAELGLQPGAQVTVIDQQPFHGPIRLRIAGAERVIGHELGHVVLCGRSDEP